MCNILEVVFISIEFLGSSPAFLSCHVFVKEKDVLLIFVMVAAFIFMLSAEV